MLENELLGELLRRLRPVITAVDTGLIFKHNDITSGLPDASVTCNRLTSWWEAKVADPKIHHSNELQRLNMRRLAIAGTAWYVVWEAPQKRTVICKPRLVGANGFYTPHETADGWDHEFVINFIRKIHGI